MGDKLLEKVLALKFLVEGKNEQRTTEGS